MLLPLIYYGNPILRKKGELIVNFNDEIKQLAKDLEETMISHHGLGLSAPQVGKSLAIFVTSPPIDYKDDEVIQAPPRVFINPKLSNPSVEGWVHSEGCLSIPKLYGDVERPVQITVTAQDVDGNEFTEIITGWPARVLMHENDHINGVLFIDRLLPQERRLFETKLKQIKKQYNK
jgi:peptide deformylase